jgi:hypothetical protein
MVTQATALRMTAEKTQPQLACYFGLAVEVIESMEQCSLIRYGTHERIVSTADVTPTARSRQSVLNPLVIEIAGGQRQH